MILSEMCAEYAGISISSVVLALGQGNPLYYEFRPFRKHPELFDGGNYLAELATGFLIQVAIEIVTDTVCLLFETRRRGLDPLAVWHGLPKARVVPIIVVQLMAATFAGQLRGIVGDDLALSHRRDMCYCVGTCYLPGGVREAYCLMIYPNSSGLPPAPPFLV
jgi:hypothetical protein